MTPQRELHSVPQLLPPRVNQRKCILCGLCLKLCPATVFEMRHKKITVVRPEACIKCGHCGALCPSNAIVESSTESKKIPSTGPGVPPAQRSLQMLFRSRRSVRHYKRKELTKKDIDKILEAGRYTATGSNSQNIRYIVITDPGKIDQLREMTLPVMMKIFSTAGKFASLPFADHFNRFPFDDLGACSISCDCLHLNCYGYELMADVWYDALK